MLHMYHLVHLNGEVEFSQKGVGVQIYYFWIPLCNIMLIMLAGKKW